MKILVTGDRNWDDGPMIEVVLLAFISHGPIIIHGAARGADTLADRAARRLGYTVQEFPAEWGKYGKAAGPIRNTRMLKEKPDLVLAFHDDIEKSKGTKDMVTQAMKAGIPVKLYSHKKEVWK